MNTFSLWHTERAVTLGGEYWFKDTGLFPKSFNPDLMSAPIWVTAPPSNEALLNSNQERNRKALEIQPKKQKQDRDNSWLDSSSHLDGEKE